MAQITTDMIIEACERDDGTGFCIACGQERMYCEPDARNYECEASGEHNEVPQRRSVEDTRNWPCQPCKGTGEFRIEIPR